jgi:hypothetical protein
MNLVPFWLSNLLTKDKGLQRKKIMKILTISDLYGRKDWLQFAKRINEYDKIIFLGNYTDGPFKDQNDMLANLGNNPKRINAEFGVTSDEIMLHFELMLKFKHKYQDKIELLLGPKDVQYLYMTDSDLRSITFRRNVALKLNGYLTKYRKYFKVAYQHPNFPYLWTNAGLSNIALREIYKDYNPTSGMRLDTYFNALFDADDKRLFISNDLLMTNEKIPRSILHTHALELKNDMVVGLNQIVGGDFTTGVMDVRNEYDPADELERKLNKRVDVTDNYASVLEQSVTAARNAMFAGDKDSNIINNINDMDMLPRPDPTTGIFFTNCTFKVKEFLVLNIKDDGSYVMSVEKYEDK